MDTHEPTIGFLAHAVPEAPPPQPDTVPTGVPAERPVLPAGPDAAPGSTPQESPMPGLPPEIGPGATPAEVPITGPLG